MIILMKASNGAVYDATLAAYIDLVPSTIILSATYLFVLFMRLYVRAYN